MSSSSDTPKFESVACDACQCKTSSSVYRFDVRNQTIDIVRCLACGLYYLNRRSTAQSIGSFYGENYYSHSLADEEAPKAASLKDRLKFAYMVDWLSYQPSADIDPLPVPRLLSRLVAPFVSMPHFHRGGRLLDVGCGAGEKLIEFRRFGWDVAGIELSESAAAEGARRGLEICTGSQVNDPPFPDESFDAVTFYHSLEHMPSPVATLRVAHRLLRPGGQVIIVVPNFGSLERKIFGKDWGWIEFPIHFYHFTKASVARLVRDAGFEIETMGDSFNGQSIDRPTDGLLRPLSQVLLVLAKPFGMLCAMFGSGKAIIVSGRRPAMTAGAYPREDASSDGRHRSVDRTGV